ncbi:hypothetical protein ACIBG8_03945 [Nonomuraea sp. NPDC050556]|uniref:hypothetical protein n=1 Tax=Nonomuraea sp. NPDC050556 TaxID=3364369 RepID=UPI00378C9343
MNADHAQDTLEEMRRMQDRTREEIARHAFARSYVLAAALGLFVGFASGDLDRPWNTIALVLGFGLFAGAGVVHEHWALVRRKPKGLELLPYAGLLVVVCVLFGAFRIAAWALFDVPAHGLVSQSVLAAAATALTYLALTPLTRRVFRDVLR